MIAPPSDEGWEPFTVYCADASHGARVDLPPLHIRPRSNKPGKWQLYEARLGVGEHHPFMSRFGPYDVPEDVIRERRRRALPQIEQAHSVHGDGMSEEALRKARSVWAELGNPGELPPVMGWAENSRISARIECPAPHKVVLWRSAAKLGDDLTPLAAAGIREVSILGLSWIFRKAPPIP